MTLKTFALGTVVAIATTAGSAGLFASLVWAIFAAAGVR